MRIDSLFYRLAYRMGKPRWDSADPQPELPDLARSRSPGRALDLGCGTGTDAIYLAGRGWEVVGLLGARGVSADDLHRRFGADLDLADERPLARSAAPALSRSTTWSASDRSWTGAAYDRLAGPDGRGPAPR